MSLLRATPGLAQDSDLEAFLIEHKAIPTAEDRTSFRQSSPNSLQL